MQENGMRTEHMSSGEPRQRRSIGESSVLPVKGKTGSLLKTRQTQEVY